MADLLNGVREASINAFNNEAASQKEQAAAQSLKKTSLGFNYVDGLHAKLFPLKSQLVEHLYVKARRADSVLSIFRSSPKSIRDDEGFKRIANHLNLLLYVAGSRLQRIYIIYLRSFQRDLANAKEWNGDNKKNDFSASASTGSDMFWCEREERAELQKLMSDLTVLTHSLLLGIAKEDIADDLGEEKKKDIESSDPFFDFAQCMAIWTKRFIQNPFDPDLIKEGALLSEKEVVGFFSAILYAEDGMRLARKIHLQGALGDSSKSSKGSFLSRLFLGSDRAETSRRAVDRVVGAAGSPEDGGGIVQVSMVDEERGASPNLSTARHKNPMAAGSFAMARQGSNVSLTGDKTPSSLSALRLALDEAVDWLKKISQNQDDLRYEARQIAWKVSQHSCALKSEISAAGGSTVSLGLQMFTLLNAKSDFGDTLEAIKQRELDALTKAKTKKVVVFHQRIFIPKHSDSLSAPEPWRVKGISYLGPFGLMGIDTKALKLKTTFPSDYRSASRPGRYEIVFDGSANKKMSIYLEEFGIMEPSTGKKKLVGSMSAWNMVTVKKQDLDIRYQIEGFAWAYPIDGMTESKAKSTFLKFQDMNLKLEATDYYFLNGGYAYFPPGQPESPVELKSLFTGAPQLLFGEPRKLPEEEYKDESLYGDITLDELKRLGARKFRWLTPSECARICKGALPPGSKLYYGAFAYLYEDPTMNSYFMMLEPAKTEKSSEAERQANGDDDEQEESAPVDIVSANQVVQDYESDDELEEKDGNV